MQYIVYKKGISLDLVQKSDGLKATYYNQENEVDEIVEGVCIHYKIHDIHPTLQSDDLKQDMKNNSAFAFHYITLHTVCIVW